MVLSEVPTFLLKRSSFGLTWQMLAPEHAGFLELVMEESWISYKYLSPFVLMSPEALNSLKKQGKSHDSGRPSRKPTYYRVKVLGTLLVPCLPHQCHLGPMPTWHSQSPRPPDPKTCSMTLPRNWLFCPEIPDQKLCQKVSASISGLIMK